MMPDDDPFWPVCSHLSSHWCNEVALDLLKGNDASEIGSGTRVCVPIFPDLGLFAEVSIGEQYEHVGHEISLVKQVNPFDMSSDEELISVGILSLDEGRYVLSTTLTAMSQATHGEMCRAASHSYPQEILHKKYQLEMSNYETIHNWCMAYYGCCLPCYGLSTSTPKPSLSMDPDAYGLGQVTAASQSSGGTYDSRSGRVRAALRSRYSSNDVTKQTT